MENSIQIIGNEAFVLYYNLNKQYSTLKKVIITKDILIGSFENEKIKELIDKLQQSDKNTYNQIFKENSEVFETNVKSELYQGIQEGLNKLSNNYVDVKLKDYNFMNSVSNAKFNVVLRCESFSITHYYAEKGTILTSIRNLIKQYLKFAGNTYRLSRLDNFQIEIYESEEVYKHIYLKKENNSLMLAASFGFLRNEPIDYTIGSEFYVSLGQEFQFFKNTQNSAVFRDHNKLVEKEINKQEKVLSNEDLVLINEKTKNIDDALIECYLSNKGQFRIVNLSLIENSLGKYSKNGFIINKSHNNYDKISLLVNKESFEEEYVNPTYWLVKSDASVKELMDDILFVEKIDGIIFTHNFYAQFLDKIGLAKNIDIAYFNKSLSKSLEEKVDWENVDIESSINTNKEHNPFKGIITEQNKEKDAMLERLKNIDLNTPKKEESNVDMGQVQTAVNGIIGSSNSSFNSNNRGNTMNFNNNNSGKKSAMDMLMQSAMNHKSKAEEEKENIQDSLNQQASSSNPNQQQPTQEATTPSPFGEEKPSTLASHSFAEKYLNQETSPKEQEQNNPQTSIQHQQTNNVEQPIQNQPQFEQQSMPQENIDHTKYHGVCATEIIVEPFLDADAYIIDQNTISQMKEGKNYYLTLNPAEIQNSNLNYILPIGLNNPNISGCDLLINNAQEFFLIDTYQARVGYFANICEINDAIKKNFIKELTLKVGKIGIICLKKDLDYLDEHIHKIKALQVKDVRSEQDLDEVRNKILAFEKRHLMNK